MSKRRHGLSLRAARKARNAQRPGRREGAAREARQQRLVPVRLRPQVQEVLSQRRPLSTAPFVATTTGSR